VKILADSWSLIEPSNILRSKAVQLVERYDLRAADSVQLAAALAWCEDAPQGRVFLAVDQKLREAARLTGFCQGDSLRPTQPQSLSMGREIT